MKDPEVVGEESRKRENRSIVVQAQLMTKLLQVVIEGHEPGQVNQLGFKSGRVRRDDVDQDGVVISWVRLN